MLLKPVLFTEEQKVEVGQLEGERERKREERGERLTAERERETEKKERMREQHEEKDPKKKEEIGTKFDMM